MFNIFIRRPVLSLVISLLIVLLGALSFFTLPVSQYPDIIPPSVSVRAKYRGANADVQAAFTRVATQWTLPDVFKQP